MRPETVLNPGKPAFMEEKSPSLKLTARIVILNYNGEDLLPKCLPSVVEAAGRSRFPVAITVLDNQSADDGVRYVQKNFPAVDVVHAPLNRVLCSYNDYLPLTKESVIILLNNDIRVDPGFVDPLLEPFLKDPQTFLVAPKVMSFDGTQVEAADTRAGMRFGLFWCSARYSGYMKYADTSSATYSSGFGAVSRDKFLELKGYDDRYLPGIMEDVDLCHRAQKAGYHLMYEPKSVVYHMGQATFKKEFGASGISVMAHRNNFLFMWKNFSGIKFWMPHLFFLPWRLIFATLKGHTELAKGFVQALKLQIHRAKRQRP